MKKMKFQRNCFLGCHRIYNIYQLKRYYAHAYIREPPARTKEAKASTSFENVTSYFCDHFFSPPSYLACKLCTSYPGIQNLELKQIGIERF